MNANGSVDVLLVEDNPLDAELTLQAFKDQKFLQNIHWVRDGEEALQLLSAHLRPQLVLLDLKMPKMDGLDVLRELRLIDRENAIPVVVLSSSTHESDIVECYRLGANGYAVKPLTFDELSNLVRSIVLYWLFSNRRPSRAAK